MSNRLQKIQGEKLLYINEDGVYFLRKRGNGIDTDVSLDTTRKSKAVEARDAYLASRVASKVGIAFEPNDRSRQVTVAEAIKRYREDGYPDKKGNPRQAGPHLRCETDACDTLLSFFKSDLVDHLHQDILDRYHAWRKRNIAKGSGNRTTDLELNTLSNALNWAIRKRLIRHNPITKRIRYHSSITAKHCKSMAPANADELHVIAGKLFQDHRSETLAWQALFEGATGLRSNEVVAMRMDARPDEPGGLTGNSLCVRRSKKAGRDNPYVEVRLELQQLLEAHKAWHDKRYPESPWFFPGRDKKDDRPISKGALTQALHRLFKDKTIPKKFTSHGLRAFYVLVRRSNGISDSQIAWEINHVGGVATLEKVYGGVPPHWLQGNGPKLGFIPRKEPAWKILEKTEDGNAKLNGAPVTVPRGLERNTCGLARR
jgi:integrase